MEIFIRSHEKVEALIKDQEWFRMFDTMAKLHQPIYGMVMSSMRVERLLPGHEVSSHLEAFKQHLYSQNSHLRFFQSPEDVAYADWLTGKFIDKKFTSVIVEFGSSELANEAMMRNLNYANSLHETERYIRNCKLRQCFRCWGYNHYVQQCVLLNHTTLGAGNALVTTT